MTPCGSLCAGLGVRWAGAEHLGTDSNGNPMSPIITSGSYGGLGRAQQAGAIPSRSWAAGVASMDAVVFDECTASSLSGLRIEVANWAGDGFIVLGLNHNVTLPGSTLTRPDTVDPNVEHGFYLRGNTGVSHWENGRWDGTSSLTSFGSSLVLELRRSCDSCGHCVFGHYVNGQQVYKSDAQSNGAYRAVAVFNSFDSDADINVSWACSLTPPTPVRISGLRTLMPPSRATANPDRQHELKTSL